MVWIALMVTRVRHATCLSFINFTEVHCILGYTLSTLITSHLPLAGTVLGLPLDGCITQVCLFHLTMQQIKLLRNRHRLPGMCLAPRCVWHQEISMQQKYHTLQKEHAFCLVTCLTQV